MRFVFAFSLAASLVCIDSDAFAAPPPASDHAEEAEPSRRQRGNVVRPAPRRTATAVSPGGAYGDDYGGGSSDYGDEGGGYGGSGGRIVEPGGGGDGYGDDHGEGDGEEGYGDDEGYGGDEPDSRDINIPVVVAPLIHDERLSGYAFISMRLSPAQGVDPWRLRENTHFALDRLIRAAHDNNLTDSSGQDIDRAVARDVFHAALVDYYGERAVGEVEISTVDTTVFRR